MAGAVSVGDQDGSGVHTERIYLKLFLNFIDSTVEEISTLNFFIKGSQERF